MHGTDFCLEGCTEKDIEEAKKCFICFSGMNPIEGTKYGEIYNNRSGSAEIFVNGIKIADEENFLFSYNISPASKSLKQMLNRERTNVGRSAYAGIVREMLLASRSEEVVKALTENYRRINKGLQCDELKWIDVQGHTAKLLNKRDKVVFLTNEEFQNASNTDREIIERSGRKPVFIPAKVKLQIEGAKDDTGTVISTIETVIAAENAAFDYLFVTQEQLDEKEKKVFGITTQILKLLSSKIRPSQIFIAEKLKRDDGNGVYEGAKKRIIIKREQLSRVESYLGTLIHELAHAESGYSDLCRGFENKLTEYLGVLAAIVVKNDKIPFVEPTAQDDANRDLLNNQNNRSSNRKGDLV